MPIQSMSLAEQLTEAHDALARDLQKLDEAAAAPAGDDLWELKTRLGTVWRHLLEHFRFEEQNGYMDAVWQREPRLERTIVRLLNEHRQLAKSLEALIEKVWTRKGWTPSLAREIQAWVQRIRQHEARENTLVRDAYHLDLGSEG